MTTHEIWQAIKVTAYSQNKTIRQFLNQLVTENEQVAKHLKEIKSNEYKG